MRLQASSNSGSAKQVLSAICLATDNVGDAVYIRGPRIGNYFQVTRINIDDPAAIPTFGLIIQKTDTTHCLVQIRGLLGNLYTGLIPNEPLFVGTDGRPTQTLPPAPSSMIGRRCIQVLGHAVDTNMFYLDPRSPIIRVT